MTDAKRRKLGPSVSFADVLHTMHTDVPAQWDRPAIHKESDILFHQIDVQELADSATLLMFGVTQSGNSVLAHITDFFPYFYIPCPPMFKKDDVLPFAKNINMQMQTHAVHRIDIVKKQPLMRYRGQEGFWFIKVTVTTPTIHARVRDEYNERSMFDGAQCTYRDLFPKSVHVYEGNLDYTLRFMVDNKVVGMNWIEIPAEKYTHISEESKISHCQIEISTRYDSLISHKPEGAWCKIAPLRILSFDIECVVRKDGRQNIIFPQAETDSVIQIANMVTCFGENLPFIRNVFTLKSCSPISGSQVLSFDDEATMLLNWRDFLQKVDPDVVIGYNTAHFDIPYLLDRANILNTSGFSFLGRLKNVESRSKEINFYAKKHGWRSTKDTTLHGRISLDVFRFVKREYKMQSYSLNAVCAHLLGKGEQKEDVPLSVITELHNGTPETRRRLAVYCLKDAYLPQRLLDKTDGLVKYIELARVTTVPFSMLFIRGESIKVTLQLFRQANELGYLLPRLHGQGKDNEQFDSLDLHSTCAAVIADYNLCYSTLLDADTAEKLNLVKDIDYIQTPNNALFIKPSLRIGILPLMIKDHMSALSDVEAAIETETELSMRTILHGRQAALKISFAYLFGITNASSGSLPCPQVASSATAYQWG